MDPTACPRFGCPLERSRQGDLGVTNFLADSDIAAEAEHAGKLFKQSHTRSRPCRHALPDVADVDTGWQRRPDPRNY